jgi:tetratricopeptide (TPR) repeat protein
MSSWPNEMTRFRMALRERDRLLAIVRSRLERFAAGQDRAVVLVPEALAEVAALAETVTSPAADLDVAEAIGSIRWARHLVLGPDQGQWDLAAALHWLEPVYEVGVAAVPDELRAYFYEAQLTAPDTPRALTEHALTVLEGARNSGDATRLDRAVGLFRKALSFTPSGEIDRVVMLSGLCLALRLRFEQTGRWTDLEEAVSAGREALAASPSDHPDRASALSRTGLALATRFENAGLLSDLDEAISVERQAVALKPGQPDHANYMCNLGNWLRIRFEQSGDRADLNEAIHFGREAVTAVPTDHPNRAPMLSNVGVALRSRFELSGDLEDLDNAISTGREAVAFLPSGHPYRAGMVSNLGIALQARFDLSGSMADLDEAIEAVREAQSSTPGDDFDHAIYASNLCNALRTRFEQSDNIADLNEAITIGREAVAPGTGEHPYHANHLTNLGLALQNRFERLGDLADLDEAITVCREAVAESTVDRPYRANYLTNLGLALQMRFERLGDLADLDEAITVDREAVTASPADHPGRALYLSNLGYALRSRYGITGSPADLDEAKQVGRRAVAMATAPPRIRARAARGWGMAAAAGGQWHDAVDGFAAAAGLMELVAPRGLARADQERLIENLGVLASDAAACCVRAGLLERAVELFEQGRSVLLGQALDTRTDLTALAEHDAALAGRFMSLRDDLGAANDYTEDLELRTPKIAVNDHIDFIRRERAAALNETIREIRQQPGFDNFLQSPPAAELLLAAAQGPLILIAISDFGSCALILDGTEIGLVPLNALTPQVVHERVAGFLGALHDAMSIDINLRTAAEQRMVETLGWLWDALVGPVLDRLGITGTPERGKPWPRIWWCVSGLLSFLPLHAAGHHDTYRNTIPATAIDRVLSSYTPTIRTLTYARRAQTDGESHTGVKLADGTMLAVAMPHTPGASSLPGVAAETIRLRQRFGDRITVLSGAQANYDKVLEKLPQAKWAHFSCHGFSDPNNPSASKLLLTDHLDHPLTVIDVARLRLDNAELAFLSACETARPGMRLTDEAIHLSSAFQIAGYRHVVGTLWPIGDQDAVEIATHIYDMLAGTGDVAQAVHAATRRIREKKGWESPSAWASHIHSGT